MKIINRSQFRYHYNNHGMKLLTFLTLFSIIVITLSAFANVAQEKVRVTKKENIVL
jgi:hypothetical protein